MSGPMNSKDLPNAIFSQASADGLSRSGSQAGPMTDLFGQALVPAKVSAAQAKAKGAKTSGISGRHGLTSSASENLQSSLGSRLQLRLPLAGGMKSRMIWKIKRSPARRQLFQLVLSDHPTAATDFGLWGTPRAQERPRSAQYAAGREMTPSEAAKALQRNLWPTPKAQNANSPAKHGEGGQALQDMIAMWPTPTTEAGLHNRKGASPTSGNGLSTEVKETLWSTPTASDHKGAGPKVQRNDGRIRNALMFQTERFGDPGNGSNAPMVKSGSLNPAFVCWLMGYPTAWENCADTVMLSSRKSRPNSSKPRAKRSGDK